MNPSKQYTWLGVVLVGLLISAFGQDRHERCLVSIGMPTYPPLARQARITGLVKVEFEIDKDGVVISAASAPEHGEAKGIPLFRPEALRNVRSWKFAAADSDEPSPTKETAIFEFKIEGEEDTASPIHCPRVTFQEHRRVEIVARAPVLDWQSTARKSSP